MLPRVNGVLVFVWSRFSCGHAYPLSRTHLERELEDVPVEVKATVAHAVGKAELAQTW